jgi:hypothetical protein
MIEMRRNGILRGKTCLYILCSPSVQAACMNFENFKTLIRIRTFGVVVRSVAVPRDVHDDV